MKRPLALAALVLALAPAASTQDQAPRAVTPASTVQSVLAAHVGKPVTLMLDSGDEVTGTVKLAGDRVVHLTSLAGKEYFDAVVTVDKVSAVMMRVR